MKELKDKKTGLIWLVPEVEGYSQDTPIYTLEDTYLVKDFTKELNEHNSKEIEKYVTGGYIQLGNFMLWAAFGKSLPFYCFEDGKLVASSIITPNNNLSKIYMLEDYVDFCRRNPSKISKGLLSRLSLRKAQQILSEAKEDNNTDIEYLVVIPREQGRGIGTRAVASIVENPKFFAPAAKVDTIYTQIHNTNKASQKAFRRNGFDMFTFENIGGNNSLGDFVKTL